MSFLCKNHPRMETEITSGHNDPQASVGRLLGSLEEVASRVPDQREQTR